MRFIGIIPARMESTRFRGKPLAQLGPRPMIWHVWAAALKSRSLEPIYIATADMDIINWCERVGAKYILTSPSCRNGTERVAQAVRQLAFRDPDDIVVNVQADEPMIRPESLDALCIAFNDPRVQITSIYFKPASPGFIANHNRVKVLVGADGNALAFTRSVASAHLWRLYGQHVGVYAYRRGVLDRLVELTPSEGLEQLAWMDAGYAVRMVEIPYATISVDTPEDLNDVKRVT
jgi:3-deoxy-manno-octulosonate cytidylyltransferase (CMP-KDO synthetase)